MGASGHAKILVRDILPPHPLSPLVQTIPRFHKIMVLQGLSQRAWCMHNPSNTRYVLNRTCLDVCEKLLKKAEPVFLAKAQGGVLAWHVPSALLLY